jgi:hypothetical protein
MLASTPGSPSSVRRAALAATSIAQNGTVLAAKVDNVAWLAGDRVISLDQLSHSRKRLAKQARKFWLPGGIAEGHHTPCRPSLRSSACARPNRAKRAIPLDWHRFPDRCPRLRCGCARDHARAIAPASAPGGAPLGFNVYRLAADQPAAPFRGALVSRSSGPSSGFKASAHMPPAFWSRRRSLQPFSNGLPTLKR